MVADNAAIFEQILGQGEHIIRTFKPHKGRFWASRFLGHLPGLIFFMIFGAIMAWVIMYDTSAYDDIPTGLFIGVVLGIVLGIPLLFYGIELLTGILWYRTRYYCFTNRRIIIQCGVLGRNYRFMDLQWAANSFVRISFLDRILRKNTGSIKFSSMPGLMMGGMHGGMSMHGSTGMHGSIGMHGGFSTFFYFLYVENPHDILREIQEQANALQGANSQQMGNLANQINHLANQMGNNQNNNQNFNNQNNFNDSQGFNNNNQQNDWGNSNQQDSWNNNNSNNNDGGWGDNNGGW